ncbi:MAG: ankyrin repeat domain-containing protein [Elainella sp.]
MHPPLRRLGLSLMLTLGVVAWHQQPNHLVTQSLSVRPFSTESLPSRSIFNPKSPFQPAPSFSLAQWDRSGQLEQQLLRAVERGNLDQVTSVLNQGANPNTGGSSGGYPLSTAVQRSQTDIVQALLNHGASPNITSDEGYTPLVEALVAQESAIVRLLLEHGANPNQTAAGMTPLALAIDNNDATLVRLLLNHGADRQQTSQGQTPLELAEAQGNAEILRLLRQ